MNCSSVDLKAYVLGEERSAEAHVASCGACQDELSRLQVVTAALRTLPQEEVPQRIAFVSDKVFEPRWWQRAWQSGPVMGFASALVLAVAILAHGFSRTPATLHAPAIDTAQMEARIEAQVTQRLEGAVARAVAATEQRYKKDTAKLLEAAENKFAFQRRADLLAAEQSVKYYYKQLQQARTLAVLNVPDSQ